MVKQVKLPKVSTFFFINEFVNFLEWVSPFFKAGPRSDVVTLLPGDIVTSVTMNEELDPPLIMAIVAGYNGEDKPQWSFSVGNNLDLGLDFERNLENEWQMIMNNRQDYEQNSMQKYRFIVQVDGKGIIVDITISNIFDNAPVVTSNSNPCNIPVRTKITRCIINMN